MTGSVPTTAGLENVAKASDARVLAQHREVLLATDASPASFAATRLVAALAARWHVTPHVCTVLPPPPMPFDPVGVNVASPLGLEETLFREVTRQIALSSGAQIWTRASAVGSPASEIVRMAEARESDLIVLGLRPHAFLDRVFRDETALSVMRNASVPVLAVTPLLTQLPRRVAVAIDFSRASIAAARAALSLLDDGSSLMLVYVEPPSRPRASEAEGYTTIFAQGVAAAFTRLRQELASRANVRIETVVLHGNVVSELLSFAQRAQVDLIAVGSQRHSIARRAVVGSVTSGLARAGGCSLFVIPPSRLA